MPLIKKAYLDTTVLEEARVRIQRIADRHDRVVVAFSGGKDSLAALYLTYDVLRRDGLQKLEVQYRDEELVPRDVLGKVENVRQLPWVNLTYLACQWEATAYILGRVRSYRQWDPEREWLRPKPAHAVTLPGVHDELFGFDRAAAELFGPGKVALITGVRAEESLNRWRSCVNKPTDNYMNASQWTKKVVICKPIFDWKANDVWRYLWENGIEYAKSYDFQMWAGDKLRVTSPLHCTPAKQLFKLREIDPLLYEQVVALFPEATVQERYSQEFSLEKVIENCGSSWWDIRGWLLKNLDQQQLRWALAEFDSVYARWQNSPDSYPLKYVFGMFVRGRYMRPMQPLDLKQRRVYESG